MDGSLKMETKRILYGDDKEEMRNALARALKTRNLELELASTPQEIIAKAKANNYHAIVTDLDYTNEGREGYEVLRQLKDLPALKVLYSGVCGFEFMAEAFDNGANYVVFRKDQSELMKILDKELGEKNGK